MANALRNLNEPGAAARWAALMYDNTPKRAAETEIGQQRLAAYYLALGHFVDTYAHTELLTHLTLRWHTKTSSDTARAVFSGVRVNEAVGFLRRLADVGIIATEERGALAPVIDQLQLINRRRNEILHHGAAGVESGKGVVSNEAFAIKADRIQAFPVSSEILDDMASDLRKINAHLLRRHMGRPPRRGAHPALDAVLDASWRYKLPEPQKPVRREEAKSRPARKRDQAQPLLPQSSEKLGEDS